MINPVAADVSRRNSVKMAFYVQMTRNQTGRIQRELTFAATKLVDSP